MNIKLTFLICTLNLQLLVAQNITYGTIFNEPESADGYTLFSPLGNRNTYLINNCGQVVNSWNSAYSNGLSAYLHTDGTLYRTARINNPSMNLAGMGGRMERFDWNGNLIWSYDYNSTTFSPHHDFCILPNGNIILIVAEKKTRQDAINAGRDSIVFNSSYNFLLTEYLIELEPIGQDSARIVWEWHVWDHLIQNFDSTKVNFGDPGVHPELIDINFTDFPDVTDWLHTNSIKYNSDLDQIMLSNRHINEIWVLDHSTSSLEASGHQGGRYGKGGDLLYRWGNPQSYRAGNSTDQILEGQHCARWTSNNRFTVFNNTPSRGFSSIEVVDLPIDSAGFYTSPTFGTHYLPDSSSRTYFLSPEFSSGRLSGAQLLPNGNILICSGNRGYFFEIDNADSMVWLYKSPVSNGGIVSQGTTNNSSLFQVFNVTRYFIDFSGFQGVNLIPGDPLEINFDLSHCDLYNSIEQIPISKAFKVFPNPARDYIEIDSDLEIKNWKIFDLSGRVIMKNESNENRIQINFLEKGMYILNINNYFYYKITIIR
jgi:hypothetical protein